MCFPFAPLHTHSSSIFLTFSSLFRSPCVWVCQFSNAIDKILPFLVSTHTHPSISPNSFSATRPIYSTQRNFLLQLVYNWSALLFLNLYFNVFCFFHLSLTTHTSRLASNYVHLCRAALPFVPCATLVSHVHIGWQSILFCFISFHSFRHTSMYHVAFPLAHNRIDLLAVKTPK